jgi:copper chaperone CopZ
MQVYVGHSSKFNSTLTMNQFAQFIIDDSTCRRCAQIIKDQFTRIPGVQGIEIDFSKGLIIIEYQSDLIQHSRFEETFQKLGYSCNDGYVSKQNFCC